jgi:hypothetical protein
LVITTALHVDKTGSSPVKIISADRIRIEFDENNFKER